MNLIPTGHTGHTATPVAAQKAATVHLLSYFVPTYKRSILPALFFFFFLIDLKLFEMTS